jgi:hypothetical protein
MNKELKDRIFDVPEHVLDKISHTVMHLDGNHVIGKERAEKLLKDRKVKYGQLKRIIHDLKTIDKIKEPVRYNLYGGELMEKWANTHLQGERDLISKRKDSKMRADNISGEGSRKNSHLKKHTKKPSFAVPVNLMKSNSQKSSISAFSSMKLFEEVEKIKKLML